MRQRWLALVVVLASVACRRGQASSRDAGITADPLPPGKVLDVAATGSLKVDGAYVLARELSRVAGPIVAIRADDDVPWGKVVLAMDSARAAGILAPDFLLATPTKRTRPLVLPKVTNAAPSSPPLVLDGGAIAIPMPSMHRVVVDRQGHIRVVDFRAPDDAAGRERLNGILTKEPNASIVIVGDVAAPFGSIVEVGALAQRAGATLVFGAEAQ